MQNEVQNGAFLHAVVANTVRGGDLVKVEDVVGVAVTDSNGTDLIAIATEGVFKVSGKDNDLVINQGDAVYLAGNGEINKTDTNQFIGFAWEDAGQTDEELVVKLVNSVPA